MLIIVSSTNTIVNANQKRALRNGGKYFLYTGLAYDYSHLRGKHVNYSDIKRGRVGAPAPIFRSPEITAAREHHSARVEPRCT